MIRARDKEKMDACPFSLRLKDVSVEEGRDLLTTLALEAGGVTREDARVNVMEGKGQKKACVEVVIALDMGTVKWWRSDRKGGKVGTIMVEGERWFYEKMLEAIMWQARE